MRTRTSGPYVVLRYRIAGGWKSWPVTEVQWWRDGYKLLS